MRLAWELRPWNLLEILDGCFLVYRRFFPLLAGIAAVTYLPFYLVAALVRAAEGPEKIVSTLLYLLFALLFYPLTFGALVSASGNLLFGEPASLKEAYRDSLRRYGALFWGNLLAWSAIVAGFCFCVVPGLLFHALLLVVPAIILFEPREGKNLLAVFRRSSQLVQAQFLKVLGVLFILHYLFSSVVALMGVAPVFALIPRMAGQGIPGGQTAVPLGFQLLELLLFPLKALLVTLVYSDLRMRKEGLDLEIRARELLART